MHTFHILTESFAVYVKTPDELRRVIEGRDRWTEIQAGSRSQAMGMGWQLRNVPMWQGRKP